MDTNKEGLGGQRGVELDNAVPFRPRGRCTIWNGLGVWPSLWMEVGRVVCYLYVYQLLSPSFLPSRLLCVRKKQPASRGDEVTAQREEW